MLCVSVCVCGVGVQRGCAHASVGPSAHERSEALTEARGPASRASFRFVSFRFVSFRFVSLAAVRTFRSRYGIIYILKAYLHAAFAFTSH